MNRSDSDTSNLKTTVATMADDPFSVPVEAIAFLAAVGAFAILLILVFLILNKALCFKNCGGFPCIEPAKKSDKKDKLAPVAAVDRYGSTSSDSD